MKNERLGFFQEVEIGTTSPYRGMKGSVVGVTEEDGVINGYAILVHAESRVLYFDKHEVAPTGLPRSRDSVD
ncbi:hypothetical protein [Bordetella sp. 02P26C-1]|uniref:hypothetical protein n=1 Tax=Bordetella sp. 02P26C-1 TaxID=2683195 RepID=UPI0013530710|nr:hypothetical protein [Bordetella sp. 02P26C-1]MVW79347.1 hypothetical protein [Bordetella sp. 02P26C-1]